jgi:hypothetical protein
MSIPASPIAPPPPVLAGARVLEYAIVDETMAFTGRLHLYRDDERVGRVPRLAICREFDDGQFLLVHCSEDWEVLGVQPWNGPTAEDISSIDDVKRWAESYYIGISSQWISLDVSLEDARAYYDAQEQEFICSFCGKGPDELRSVFRGGNATICGDCVRELYRMLDEPDEPQSLQ